MTATTSPGEGGNKRERRREGETVSDLRGREEGREREQGGKGKLELTSGAVEPVVLSEENKLSTLSLHSGSESGWVRHMDRRVRSRNERALKEERRERRVGTSDRKGTEK